MTVVKSRPSTSLNSIPSRVSTTSNSWTASTLASTRIRFVLLKSCNLCGDNRIQESPLNAGFFVGETSCDERSPLQGDGAFEGSFLTCDRVHKAQSLGQQLQGIGIVIL